MQGRHTAITRGIGLGVGLTTLLLLGGPPVRAAGNFEHDELVAALAIDRLLPAVVAIITDVRAEVTLRCGTGDVHTLEPTPHRESGTGFLIHPDGWVATNGHVVLPVHKPDEAYAPAFLQEAAKAACAPRLQKLPANQRAARMNAIVADPANRRGVKVTKQIQVYLPTGTLTEYYPAVVKAYSPPIDPDKLPTPRGRPNPPMLDAAILKIEGKDLPAVPLSQHSIWGIVHLGQQIFITGYPGVVLWHTFLGQESQAEPSVTFGRISAFRLDVNGRRVLQTDAAISWGNSGGPAFNLRGEVVGVATFISTTLEGDEAIQGFNFLIPIDTIQELAAQAGVTPSAAGAFTREWDQALDAYIAGQFDEALTHAEAADRLVPGLTDVLRVTGGIRRQQLGTQP
jgi:S1-C subfamily serine protease